MAIDLTGRAKLVVEEERAQVVSTLADMLELSRQSSEQIELMRQETGTKESLAEPARFPKADLSKGESLVPPLRPEQAQVDTSVIQKAVDQTLILGEPTFDPTSQVSQDSIQVDREDTEGFDLITAATEQLKVHEGYKPYPYKDSVGKWTIGIGHLIGDGSDEALASSPYADFSEENPMSDEEVQSLFNKDFEEHERIAREYPAFEKMNETGRLALIDMTFNMGDLRVGWPNTLKLLEEGRYEEAATVIENSKYARQVGNRAKKVASQIRAAGS